MPTEDPRWVPSRSGPRFAAYDESRGCRPARRPEAPAPLPQALRFGASQIVFRPNIGSVQLHAWTVPCTYRPPTCDRESARPSGRRRAAITGRCLDRGHLRQCWRTYPASSDPLLTAHCDAGPFRNSRIMDDHLTASGIERGWTKLARVAPMTGRSISVARRPGAGANRGHHERE